MWTTRGFALALHGNDLANLVLVVSVIAVGRGNDGDPLADLPVDGTLEPDDGIAWELVIFFKRR